MKYALIPALALIGACTTLPGENGPVLGITVQSACDAVASGSTEFSDNPTLLAICGVLNPAQGG